MDISIREFQLNASKYLDKLPVTLTRYGEPVAVVNPVGGTQSVPELPEESQESIPAELPQKVESTFINVPSWARAVVNEKIEEPVIKEPSGIVCMAPNTFCKNDSTHLITFENPETFRETQLCVCEKHLAEIKKTVEVKEETL